MLNPNPALIFPGLVTLAIGVLVMTGWHTRDINLIQLHPQFVPMQYNTAISFLGLGCAFLLQVAGRYRGAALACVLTLVVAVLTLLQYVTGIDIGIDEFLIEHYITVETSHPGRMAPNTAVCFILSALALLFIQSSFGARLAIALSFGMLVAALGAIALAGYAADLPSAQGWGNLTRMAAHTAFGFVVIGSSISLFAWRQTQRKSAGQSVWTAFSLGAAVSLMAVTLWQSMLDEERARLQRDVTQQSRMIETGFGRAMQVRIIMLEQMAEKLAAAGGTADESWNRETRRLLLGQDREFSALRFFDKNYEPGWTVLANPGEDPWLSEPVDRSVLRFTLEQARATRKTRLTPALEMRNGREGLFIAVPLFVGERFRGNLVGIFDTEGFISQAVQRSQDLGYRFTVQENDRPIYSPGEAATAPDTEPYAEFAVDMGMNRWTFRTSAGPVIREQYDSNLPELVLVIGLLLAVSLAFSVYLAQNAVFQARELRNSGEALRRLNEDLEKIAAARSRAAVESEEELRRLLDSTAEGILGLDSEGRCTRANPAAVRLLGFDSQAEFVGKEMHALIHHSRPDGSPLPIESCRIRSAYRVGNTAHSDNEVFWRADGTPIEVEYWSYPIMNAGELEGAVVTFIDISERRRAERRIRQINDELLRSNKDLEQFAYVASHDLQEPLRMVASYTQLLARRYEGQLDAEADRFIGYATEGAKRMQTLINGLLDFARLGTGTRNYEDADCNIALETALTDLQISIKEAKATISYDELPVVHGNQAQLVHLFQNFIANALKFRREDPPRIHVAALEEGDHWRFTIRDNGIGVDPKYAERIFEIFQRLHARDDFAGAGIGLALCKRIVEQHGGRLWVENNEDHGATFCFTLPIVGKN